MTRTTALAEYGALLAPVVEAPDAMLVALRELRVYHWRQCLAASANRDRAASGELAERYRKEWALHMGFVQSLNVFFAVGDYAEQDAAVAHHPV